MKEKVYAKKSLGQNFLIDDRIKSRIIDACDLSDQETILEIGPGQGALTRILAPHVKTIMAVEKDRDLVPQLRAEFSGTNIQIFQGDFLDYDLTKLPKGVKIIGNLPYNISTPIITKVLENRHRFKALYMTVQYEFGARLIAKPNSKDYGSMTLFTQFYSTPQLLFKIHPRAFRPIPKVTSCFMKLDLSVDPPAVADERVLFLAIRQAFAHRRKRVSNSLGSLAPKEVLALIFDKAKIDPMARAEDLTMNQYIQFADALVEYTKESL